MSFKKFICFFLKESDFLYKRSPKSFYDSISMDIPDENTKRVVFNDIGHFANQITMKNCPILTSSPSRNMNKIELKNEEILMSFQENQIKDSKKQSIKEFLLENKCKKLTKLKDSTENKGDFSIFMHDVSESLEKKSQALFYRNKTPEFAKFFQNSAKEQNFFKGQKTKEIQEKNEKFFETFEEMNGFCEKKEEFLSLKHEKTNNVKNFSLNFHGIKKLFRRFLIFRRISKKMI